MMTRAHRMASNGFASQENMHTNRKNPIYNQHLISAGPINKRQHIQVLINLFTQF